MAQLSLKAMALAQLWAAWALQKLRPSQGPPKWLGLGSGHSFIREVGKVVE